MKNCVPPDTVRRSYPQEHHYVCLEESELSVKQIGIIIIIIMSCRYFLLDCRLLPIPQVVLAG